MFRIVSLSEDELNLLRKLVCSEFWTFDYRFNHSSGFSCEEVKFIKSTISLLSDLRIKLVCNVVQEDYV